MSRRNSVWDNEAFVRNAFSSQASGHKAVTAPLPSYNARRPSGFARDASTWMSSRPRPLGPAFGISSSGYPPVAASARSAGSAMPPSKAFSQAVKPPQPIKAVDPALMHLKRDYVDPNICARGPD